MVDDVTEALPPHSAFDTILVLDFGSQTSHSIIRRIRSLNCYAEMLPCTTKIADLSWKPVAIILSGGPASVYNAKESPPHVDAAIFTLGVPILGICYGCQEIAWQVDVANVARGEAKEYGYTDVAIKAAGGASHIDRLFQGMGNKISVWMSHTDKLVRLPEGYVTIASTQNSEFAAIAHAEKPIFGIQFHPELDETPCGLEVLQNFITICGARQHWVMGDFIELEVKRIRDLVGEKAQVIGAVSGGVDSTVAARIMQKAIGDRFHAILVDNGLMRLNECEEVKENLDKQLNINLTVVPGSDVFLGSLKGITEPETKRKIIGGIFIDLFEKEAQRIEEEAKNTPNAGKVEYFVQGTLYPDVIESMSYKGPSATIKSHHNVGGLPQRMMDGEGLKLIEPLRELFKDEVREFGRRLGISEDLVMRMPCPGPALAIRIIGEVTPDRVEIVRHADHIFMSMIKEAGIYNEISQAYAALDTNRVVGVQGDERVYGYLVILRAVITKDYMSAKTYRFDWSFLEEVSRRIVNEVDGVARVVYDLTSKPPGTIELE